MIPEHEHAGKVWEQTLSHIRSTRQRRKRVKESLTTCLICGLIILGFMLQPQKTPAAPHVAVAEDIQEPMQSIAVMKVGDDGVIRLEECLPGELGSIELVFGLTPIISNDWEDGSL